MNKNNFENKIPFSDVLKEARFKLSLIQSINTQSVKYYPDLNKYLNTDNGFLGVMGLGLTVDEVEVLLKNGCTEKQIQVLIERRRKVLSERIKEEVRVLIEQAV